MTKEKKPANRKDAKIGELQLELDEANARIAKLEEMEGAYAMRHSGYNKDPWGDGKLPIPRLQFHYEDKRPDFEPWAEFNIHYSLVMRHFLGHIIVIPLGLTGIGRSGAMSGEVRKGPFDFEEKLYEPFREGAHIVSDMKELKLPAFKVFGDVIQPVADIEKVQAHATPVGEPYLMPRYGFEPERLPENQVDEEEGDEEEGDESEE